MDCPFFVPFLVIVLFSPISKIFIADTAASVPSHLFGPGPSEGGPVRLPQWHCNAARAGNPPARTKMERWISSNLLKLIEFAVEIV